MSKLLEKISKARGQITNDFNKCVYCGICEKSCIPKAIKVTITAALSGTIDKDGEYEGKNKVSKTLCSAY